MKSKAEGCESKSQYWQMIRGICMLAVIMIHCPVGNSYSSIESAIWLMLRQLINFPVALFVFMAGFFLNQKKMKENRWIYMIRRGGGTAIIAISHLEYIVYCSDSNI